MTPDDDSPTPGRPSQSISVLADAMDHCLLWLAEAATKREQAYEALRAEVVEVAEAFRTWRADPSARPDDEARRAMINRAIHLRARVLHYLHRSGE